MPDTTKIGYLLQALARGVAAHDRENPAHHTWGIGMSQFDIERLGLDEGEEILPGIVLEGDAGVTGNFRVLCDGQHGEGLSEEEEELIDAIAADELADPVYSPGPGTPPRVTPPL